METDTKRIDDIVGHGLSDQSRLVQDHNELLSIVNSLKERGLRICYTFGVYDLHHIGHARYLDKGKQFGDILIVGLDTDEFTKARKGEGRPIVPFEER